MNIHSLKRYAALLGVAFYATFNAFEAMAQISVPDNFLVGVWVPVSMRDEARNINYISENYTQVKVYGPNGEYACAEVRRQTDGIYRILPHEYGTYSLKDGAYTEMGRPVGKDVMIFVDQNTLKGSWHNIVAKWKRRTDMSDALRQYILMKCKAEKDSEEGVQKMIREGFFGK